jgi:hypothetical protein
MQEQEQYENNTTCEDMVKVDYLDCVSDVGKLMREIDALLSKYQGTVLHVGELNTHLTFQETGRVLTRADAAITDVSVGISLCYDPRILHQGILPATPQTELNV